MAAVVQETRFSEQQTLGQVQSSFSHNFVSFHRKFRFGWLNDHTYYIRNTHTYTDGQKALNLQSTFICPIQKSIEE